MFETIPKIRIFINLLLILQICLGIAIIAVAWYHQHVLATFLTETEAMTLSSRFFNAYILGFQLFVSFLCGLSMWSNVWPRRYSESIHLLLGVWLIYCFLIVACGCATIWTLLNSSQVISEGVEIILLKGIDSYYTNPEWKFLWDKVQYSKECCGVHGYQDWMQAAWMSENVNSYSKVVVNVAKLRQYNQELYDTTECSPEYYDTDNGNVEPVPPHQLLEHQILAPYACCKQNSMSCYENYMPHLKRSGDSTPLPHLNLTDINTDGCFSIFSRHLIVAVNTLFVLILIAVVIVILICCLTKYLMATNFKRSYREYNNDLCMFDDEGNALVVIKCPPKVKCITLEEPNSYSGSDIPNLVSSGELCPCCSGSKEAVAATEEQSKSKEKNNCQIVH